MKTKKSAWLAWTLCAIVVACELIGLAFTLNTPDAPRGVLAVVNNLLNVAFVIFFGLVGALILGRYPRHTIGWLLMFMALSLAAFGMVQAYLGQTLAASSEFNLTEWLYIWLSGWTWWLLIAPLLLILLLFPTGRLLSRRWRWVVAALAIIVTFFIAVVTFSATITDPASGKIWANPLGLLPGSFSFEGIIVPWVLTLLTVAACCVLSVVIRYRRAASVERAQLKWFLLACLVFLATYPLGFLSSSAGASAAAVSGILLSTVILLIPASIGIAILRYRLFDIDVIIRRTLIYSILTALLAVIYFGGVVLMEQLTRSITASSDIAIVVSTLIIAALFFPVRRRVQTTIDRRFYRRKYDAAKTLAAFSATVRDEVELDKLTGELIHVVSETMQPAHVSVWLKN